MKTIDQTKAENERRARDARVDALLRIWAGELADHITEVWFPTGAPEQQVENFKKLLYDAFKRVEDRAINGIRPGDEQ